MPATFSAPALGRLPGRSRLLRLVRHRLRPQRVHVSDLSDELRRDLGFIDGRITAPRNPLRD
jgi:hypothetical protein